jgi:DNA-binding NtrC family response regulator
LDTKVVSVLIVDHEEATSASLTKYLGAAYACVRVKSADAAMQQLAAASFNLAITDITMVSTSGLPLCRLIRESYPDTVVVAASRTHSAEGAIEAVRQGAAGYIATPFDSRQVCWSVERALRCHAPAKPTAWCETADSVGIRHSTPKRLIASGT